VKTKNKEFDCVKMKRQIQEKIFEETKDMTHQELLDYFRKRIANSRFAPFLQKSEDKSKLIT